MHGGIIADMKRWVSTLGSLVLLGACRMFVASDKHPPFRGAIRQPVWTVEGISAESIAAGEEVVLVMGAQSGETSKRLFALHAATGRRLWTSSFAPKRVVAMGSETAFVLISKLPQKRLLILLCQYWRPRTPHQ